jgi:hypothetical protein
MEKEKSIDSFSLSNEQKYFVNKALQGCNILVNACIGSGKTTAIQKLCEKYPKEKKILYLTYNTILKADAKNKIKQNNVMVTNYHGFAFSMLRKAKIKDLGISELPYVFLKEKPEIESYDVLLIDEFQDIRTEFADMLEYIKSKNPNMQIIAVGDMDQKIYDETNLDVMKFIDDFLGGNHICMKFTECFRLPSKICQVLGMVWNKTIVGVNEECKVEAMSFNQVFNFISKQELDAILCLGKKEGKMIDLLNRLENKFPKKFNKKTVYASIRDVDSSFSKINIKNDKAIFTTYDSSKGLERKIVVIFDFTKTYWDERRSLKSLSKFEILRNIFCVAASRGKQRIIFVKDSKSEPLKVKDLMACNNDNYAPFIKNRSIDISNMFQYKAIEEVEQCFKLLDIKRICAYKESIINIKNNDGLIDLSPCIGLYIAACYFKSFSFDSFIKYKTDEEMLKIGKANLSLDEKILRLFASETKQQRYITQVKTPFVTQEQQAMIKERLKTTFDSSEQTEVECSLEIKNERKEKIEAVGRADVLKDNIVYELKFVSDLSHEHFLQCACYMMALNIEIGRLWNVRDNTMFEITIPDKRKLKESIRLAVELQKETCLETIINNYAVIDTETTYPSGDDVMSIGVVISKNNSFDVIERRYYLLDPECKKDALYSDRLYFEKPFLIGNRYEAIESIIQFLNEYNVKDIYAYNAGFDFRHLPELSSFVWRDIMPIAINKNTNNKIPLSFETYSTGRLKHNYGLQNIMNLMMGNDSYFEKHNSLSDAEDESLLIKMLGNSLLSYPSINYSHNFADNGSPLINEQNNSDLFWENNHKNQSDYIETESSTVVLYHEHDYSESPRKQIDNTYGYMNLTETAKYFRTTTYRVKKELYDSSIRRFKNGRAIMINTNDFVKHIKKKRTCEIIIALIFIIIQILVFWFLLR